MCRFNEVHVRTVNDILIMIVFVLATWSVSYLGYLIGRHFRLW